MTCSFFSKLSKSTPKIITYPRVISRRLRTGKFKRYFDSWVTYSKTWWFSPKTWWFSSKTWWCSSKTWWFSSKTWWFSSKTCFLKNMVIFFKHMVIFLKSMVIFLKNIVIFVKNMVIFQFAVTSQWIFWPQPPIPSRAFRAGVVASSPRSFRGRPRGRAGVVAWPMSSVQGDLSEVDS